MNGLVSLAASRSYTDESLDGMGALKGAACQIASITDIEGGHRINFLWLDNSEVEHTDHMDVMNGEKGGKGDKGDTGVGLPEGGTAGQVLVKKSSTDYDTEWGTPAGGGDMLKSVYDTDNDGKVDSAENADTVGGHTVAKDVPADAKFTDTVYDDTEIRGEIADKVDKVDGKGLSTNDYTDADKAKLAGVEAGAEVNTIESITLNGTEVTPDANKNVALTVITKAVNDLVNYYLKSETYSKTEVDDIVTALKNSRFEVVATLPTTDIKTNVIYLVPKSPSQTSNVKDEYINLDGTTAGWEKIGDTEIDLSNYVTTQALNTALADYTTTSDLTTLLAAKQDTLTFDNAPTENSNNPVKSGGVYTANQKLYKLDAAYGVKNLAPRLKSQTINNVTFDINDDGSITVNGTAASDCWYDICGQDINNFLQAGENYIASGCPEGGSDATFFMYIGGTYLKYVVDDTSFTCDAAKSGHFYICVRTNTVMDNVVFYPMIRHASYVDDTYQSYAKTNKQLTSDAEALANQVKDMNNILGSKNLLRQVNNGDVTSQGITFSPNDDGSITLSGTNTSSSASYYYISKGANLIAGDYEGAGVWLPKGDYIVSGGVETQNGDLQVIDITEHTTTSIVGAVVGDTPFTLTKNTLVAVRIRVNANKTASGTAYPMIRLASISDDTYEPYAKTNQQLTEDTTALLDNLEVNGAVNMLPNNATTQTINGITFTVNDDGTINVSGTATANANLTIGSFNIKAGTQYTISDGIGTLEHDDVAGVMYATSVPAQGEAAWYWRTDYIGDPVDRRTAIANYDAVVTAYIRIPSGATINYKFKPMFTLASYNGPYVPYAKTNKELTEDVTSLDAMYDGKTPSAVSDLNVPLTAGGASVALTRHINGTTNAPTTGGGLEITWSSSDKYGAQLTLTDGGLYFRTNSGGTISAWQKIST